MENKILTNLNENKNFMIARLGATEAKAVLYPSLPKVLKFLTKKIIFKRMFVWSGFFPVTEENIIKFSNLYRSALNDTDILASWRIEEKFISEAYKIKLKINLKELEPYYSNNPWTKLLKKKKNFNYSSIY